LCLAWGRIYSEDTEKKVALLFGRPVGFGGMNKKTAKFTYFPVEGIMRWGPLFSAINYFAMAH